MSEYVLWGGGSSRSMLVEMVLAEAGADYEVRDVDIRSGGHEDPAFLAVNPLGWVPALTTPAGETLAETPAINLWLCEEHGLNLVPPPGDPLRGRFLQAFHNVIGEVEPTLKRVFFAHRYVLRAEDTEEMRELAWTMTEDRLARIEMLLVAEGPYFLGERFSLADLTLAYWTTYAHRAGRLGTLSAVKRVYTDAQARPALAPIFARVHAAIDAYRARLASS
ncbi:MAG: glutathione S-transferase family protein [Pseudomonadota bacterium]